jgi:hypothetical protein
VVDSLEGFNFLGFAVRWIKSRKGTWYPHVEPSAKSAKRLRETLREKLNHWTLGERTPQVITGLNRTLRGWSGYYHYRNSSRALNKLNWHIRR